VLGQVSFHLFFLFFTFHRSKLGYNNHEDIEIVMLLNVSSTKTAHYHTLEIWLSFLLLLDNNLYKVYFKYTTLIIFYTILKLSEMSYNSLILYFEATNLNYSCNQDNPQLNKIKYE
jgi:hypothetical protein